MQAPSQQFTVIFSGDALEGFSRNFWDKTRVDGL